MFPVKHSAIGIFLALYPCSWLILAFCAQVTDESPTNHRRIISGFARGLSLTRLCALFLHESAPFSVSCETFHSGSKARSNTLFLPICRFISRENSILRQMTDVNHLIRARSCISFIPNNPCRVTPHASVPVTSPLRIPRIPCSMNVTHREHRLCEHRLCGYHAHAYHPPVKSRVERIMHHAYRYAEHVAPRQLYPPCALTVRATSPPLRITTLFHLPF